MYRLYMVHHVRKMLNVRNFGIAWFAFLSLALLWFVSVLNVARNFWVHVHDIPGAYTFFTNAFLNTSLVVQGIMIGLLAVIAFFIFDLYRVFMYSR